MAGWPAHVSATRPTLDSLPSERFLRKGRARSSLPTCPSRSHVGQQAWCYRWGVQPNLAPLAAAATAAGTTSSRAGAGCAASQASWLQAQKQRLGGRRGFVGGATEGVPGSWSVGCASQRSGRRDWHTHGALGEAWVPDADAIAWKGSSTFGGRLSQIPQLPLGMLSLPTLGRKASCHPARPAAGAASLPGDPGSRGEGPGGRGARASGQGVSGTAEGAKAARGPRKSKGAKGSKTTKASQGSSSSGDSTLEAARARASGSADVVRRIVEAIPAQIPMREGPPGPGPATGPATGQRFEGAPWPGLASLEQGGKGQARGEGSAQGGVYLKDLLREHQGRLYVPQEAVALASSYSAAPAALSADRPLSSAQGQAGTVQGEARVDGLFGGLSAGERAAFEERLRRCPEMSFKQFEEFSSKGQVLLLASRGLPSEPAGQSKGGRKGRAMEQAKEYQYGVDTGGALLVLLRDVPGEKPLQSRTW